MFRNIEEQMTKFHHGDTENKILSTPYKGCLIASLQRSIKVRVYNHKTYQWMSAGERVMGRKCHVSKGPSIGS